MPSNKFKIEKNEDYLWFKEYPDYPVFSKNMIPNFLYQHTEINPQKIIDHLINSEEFIENQYKALKIEFDGLDTIKKRREHRKSKNNNLKIAHSFFLSDASQLKEKSNIEAQSYWELIKEVNNNGTQLKKFRDNSISKILTIMFEHGYDIDLDTGEICEL